MRILMLCVALMLVTAACSGDGSSEPATGPAPASTTAPTTTTAGPTTTVSATPTNTLIVTFDGEAATYRGPADLTAGEITFTFDATQYDRPVQFLVAEVTDGSVTLGDTEALAAAEPASGEIPPFIGLVEAQLVVADALDASFTLTAGRWLIAAVTAPEDSDRVYPAVILEVTGSDAGEAGGQTIATTPAGVLDPTFELAFDGTRCDAEGPSAVPPGDITVFLVNDSDLPVAAAVRRLDEPYTAQDWLDAYPPGEWHDREPWIGDVPQLGLGLPEGVELPAGGTATRWRVGVTTEPGQHEIHLGIVDEGLWGCTGFVVAEQ